MLRVEKQPAPEPQVDDVLIEVKAAGLNQMDTYARRGMLETMFPRPLRLGVDGAGVVIAVGDRATARVGDRVAWDNVPGSYAEVVAALSERIIPIPEGVSFEAADAGLMQGMTAQHLCAEAVPVAPDPVVLVHSAGSGVGRMMTQMATRCGGRVIGTVSKPHKARVASDAGAWRVLVRDEIEDLGASIPGGRIPPIDLREQPFGVHLVRYTSSDPTEPIDQRRQRAVQVLQWIDDKTLDVLVDRIYPLQDAASAHCDLESQQTVGKLLLVPDTRSSQNTRPWPASAVPGLSVSSVPLSSGPCGAVSPVFGPPSGLSPASPHERAVASEPGHKDICIAMRCAELFDYRNGEASSSLAARHRDRNRPRPRMGGSICIIRPSATLAQGAPWG